MCVVTFRLLYMLPSDVSTPLLSEILDTPLPEGSFLRCELCELVSTKDLSRYGQRSREV